MPEEQELTEEQIAEESQALRAEVAAETWEGVQPDLIPSELVQEEVPVEDPWAGVNPSLRQSIENLTSRIENLSVMENRLKQAEKRVGSIQNELFVARQASKQLANAPSAEQIAQSAETEKKWNELKEDFPEWATAIDAKLSAMGTEFAQKIPLEIEGVEEKIKAGINSLKNELSGTLERKVLTIKHPGWEQIKEDAAYKAWIAGQPEEVRVKTTSPYAEDAIFVLDKFVESQKPVKSATEIAAERKKRLQTSEVVTGQGRKAPKAEADMSPQELRQIEAKKIWANR